jgi:4'-phosphopantetheinyl transferase
MVNNGQVIADRLIETNLGSRPTVWWIKLRSVNLSCKCLSSDERRRAARIRAFSDRQDYVATHVAMRQLLAKQLGRQPDALKFDTGAYGKPRLIGCQLEFNLCHSGGLSGLAISSRHGAVGLDCEQCVPPPDIVAVAEQFCTSKEVRLIRGLRRNRAVEVFFDAWTRKEAVLKAAGCGLSVDPRTIDVAVGLGIRPVEVLVPGHGNWWVRSMPSPPGYAAAFASARREGCDPSIFWWPDCDGVSALIQEGNLIPVTGT